MSDVTTSADVHVPVRTAYNQWTQFESFPEFMSGVVAVRQLDDRHTHWVTEVAGTRREFDAEIVEQLPDERIRWRSTDGDVRHTGTVSFQPLAEGRTRVTVDLAWEPEGLIEKAAGAVGVDRLQVKADLERFRRFIEDRGAETGRWRGRVPEPPSAAGDVEPLAGTAPPPADAWNTDEPGRSQDDVVDVLVAQHEQVKDLMARTAAAEGEEKKRLFGELVHLLKTHEKGEQRVVHPVTRTSVDGGATTANSRLGEEERADQLIAEVQTMIADSREFDMWFEQLRHAVLDHAAHEEQEEFPALRRQLSAARLRTMAEELVAAQTAQN
jgi:ribosome-associated toxin RatA of RatAB toxin-antitoxin module